MARNRKTKVDRRRTPNRRGRPSTNRRAESRATQSAQTSRLKPTVSQGGRLKLPKPPKGIVYRWVAKEVVGLPSISYNDRMEEGWKPIRPEDLPPGHEFYVTKHSAHGSILELRGQIACQMSEEQFLVNEQYWENKARKETAQLHSDIRRNVGENVLYPNREMTQADFNRGIAGRYAGHYSEEEIGYIPGETPGDF